jgi:glycosyltransferase involved in cell wall biosynthesis
MSSCNIYAPINELGYGKLSRGLITGLLQNKVEDIFLSPIGQVDIENKAEVPSLQALVNNPWYRHRPSVAIWHEFDLAKFSGDKLVAFPIFETTEMSAVAKNYLSQMDAIFVLSKWAKQVVESNIKVGIPVVVVPGGSTLIETPNVVNAPKNTAFTFCTVGKFESRKAHLELISAYGDAFCNASEDTRLMCHIYNPFIPNFAQAILGHLNKVGFKATTTSRPDSLIATRGNAVVQIFLGRLSEEQVYQLYRTAHIGVFPAKAEGWNLPLMEAIKSGLPCIATNYSAHTEYLTSEYDYNFLRICILKYDTQHDYNFLLMSTKIRHPK